MYYKPRQKSASLKERLTLIVSIFELDLHCDFVRSPNDAS